MPIYEFRWRYVTLIALILQVFFVTICVSAPSQDAEIASIIEQALSDPSLRHGLQGVLIESLRDNRLIYEKNADLVFIPASNFKILVSAAALDTLGPNYRFKTFLFVNGTQTADGVLKGDVIIKGRGDPVLKYEHIEKMASSLKEIGIKVIEGNIVGDDTWFDSIRLGWGWSWDNEPYYYSAQISALNLNENIIDVWVRPGNKVGDPAVVKLSPPTSYVTVVNECRTSSAKSEKTIFIDRLRGKNVIRVTGTVALDYKPERPEEAITVEEPTLFACHRLIEVLRTQGIEVKGQAVRGKKPKDARYVMSIISPPLSEILRLLNKPSDNLIAEVLLKTLGAERKGKGSASAGEQVELDFLKKIGADITAISISDGSGLSRHNLISPRNLVTILKYMYNHKHSKVYLESLPIAGVDGTLRKRMKGTPAEGNVRAKTGYVGRVCTLSGFVTTKAGEPLVFSIMFNHHLCSHSDAIAVMDKIMSGIAGVNGSE
ncbi:MAG: D-alanyl-D-alanine carboxypeptidase/D-alanyl-D-alanine-endopeptidase [Armatimonadota bacterium]|nr:D-alanyl-D-alanine carboxypeptidase/D-alanyl-D-alanine-endopeptidase [Armatimonadota bacterium]